jgi:beta-L-arabinofuranosidase (glycosyl hydrolase family 127)/glycosyl hydrolase family 127 (putative beta-L-arabinofuranosidase)/ricin-type beta-trefoil lectin protein
MIQNRLVLVLLLAGCGWPAAHPAKQAETSVAQQLLVNRPFSPLPTGAVRADGWLLKMLQLQRDGFTGAAEALYGELGASSAWRGGNAADSDWERPPYYVKGLVALAYVLDDAGLEARARGWIDWTIDSQRADGSFGPTTSDDWWPRMVMLYAVKDYYEATQDARVLTFLTRYFGYQATQLGGRPLRDWGKARGGDNIDLVLWLHRQTGDASLLTLADTLRSQSYDWTSIFTNDTFTSFGADFQPRHNVNVSQAIKMPVIYFQRSNAAADRAAFAAGNANLQHDHGQATGMSSGTEMLAGTSSVAGVETCAVVERLQSDETALAVLGDAAIGDQLETIAFNALPAAFDKASRVHQYYTLPNQVQSVRGDHGYEQEYANGLMPGPYSGFPCCRFNMHMGWPYFVKNMWAATADGGLAVLAYGPSHVTTQLPGAGAVTITESTNYPFDEQVRLTVQLAGPASFPLRLRIPAWSAGASVAVNGVAQAGVSGGAFYTVSRTWSSGDIVTVTLPMPITVSTQVNDSVAVHRGPLVYSLQIAEQWTVTGTSPVAGYNESAVTPKTPWSYGLVIDRANPAAAITVHRRPMPVDGSPFVQANTPITLSVPARRIPAWQLRGVSADEVPHSPIYSNEPTESVTLVPFGAENLRVTYFPVIGNGSGALPAYFMIVNRNSGLCLDLIGGDLSNGARINQWTCDVNSPNQRWAILPTEHRDHFELVSALSGKSACIDADSLSDGAQLHDWTYTGNNPAQQFDLVETANGWFKIRNVKSGKVLDVDAFSTANDGKVQQWSDNGGQGNQLWRLQPWGDYFIATSSGKYVCVKNQGSANGDRIIQYAFEPNPWFLWRFQSVGEGMLEVASLNAPSKALCVEGAATTAGHWCHLWEYNPANVGDQKVRLVPQTDGTVKLYFAHDGQSWDVPGGQTGNEIELDQYPDNANPWQRFRLERAPNR